MHTGIQSLRWLIQQGMASTVKMSVMIAFRTTPPLMLYAALPSGNCLGRGHLVLSPCPYNCVTFPNHLSTICQQLTMSAKRASRGVNWRYPCREMASLKATFTSLPPSGLLRHGAQRHPQNKHAMRNRGSSPEPWTRHLGSPIPRAQPTFLAHKGLSGRPPSMVPAPPIPTSPA